MITKLLQPSELARLKTLQMLARNRVEGFCSGLHRSPNKGQSVEFREHRPYARGDEVRSIDWNVFAKSDRLFIRQYEEETNLQANLILDCSGSMRYAGTRTGGISKWHYACKLAGSFAYLMLNQQDSVGLVTFDQRIRTTLPPRSTATHLSAISAALLSQEVQSKESNTDFVTSLSPLLPRLRRGGVIVLFTDCFGDLDSLATLLGQFRQARNDVIVFQVLDRDECDFPFRKPADFRSLELPSLVHRLDPVTLRNAYLDRFKKWQTELVTLLAKTRIELVPLVTDLPFEEALAEFLSTRSRRR